MDVQLGNLKFKSSDVVFSFEGLGIDTGGLITINGTDNKKIDIGQVPYKDRDPVTNKIVKKTLPALIGITVPNIATAPSYFVTFDVNKTWNASNIRFVQAQDISEIFFNTNLQFGRILNDNGTPKVQGVFRYRVHWSDDREAVRRRNIQGTSRVQGGYIEPNGTNLNLDLTKRTDESNLYERQGAGTPYENLYDNITYYAKRNFPDLADDSAFTFFEAYNDGTGKNAVIDTNGGVGFTSVNVDQYDNAGTKTTKTVGKGSNYLVIVYPNGITALTSTKTIIIVYGTKDNYGSATLARDALLDGSDFDTVDYRKYTSVQGGIPTVYISAEGGITDLSGAGAIFTELDYKGDFVI
jgi:hypothetical protein